MNKEIWEVNITCKHHIESHIEIKYADKYSYIYETVNKIYLINTKNSVYQVHLDTNGYLSSEMTFDCAGAIMSVPSGFVSGGSRPKSPPPSTLHVYSRRSKGSFGLLQGLDAMRFEGLDLPIVALMTDMSGWYVARWYMSDKWIPLVLLSRVPRVVRQ